MKRNFLNANVITVVMVSMLLLCGCSNDEQVPPVEAAQLNGVIPRDQLTFTLNGKPAEDYVGFMFEDNQQLPETAYDYDMNLKIGSVYDFEVSNIWQLYSIPRPMPLLDIKYDLIPVKLKGDSENMTFEGELLTPHICYTVTGRIENPTSSTRRHVYVNLERSLREKIEIIGTYEFNFDESSMYQSCSNIIPPDSIDVFGKKLSFSECCDEFRNRSLKAFVKNSGYTGARITFNPDLSMEVYLRDANSKKYYRMDGDFSYWIKDDYIIFTCLKSDAKKMEEWREICDDLYPKYPEMLSYANTSSYIFRLSSHLFNKKLKFEHLNEYCFLSTYLPYPLTYDDVPSDIFWAHNFLYGFLKKEYHCDYIIDAERVND